MCGTDVLRAQLDRYAAIINVFIDATGWPKPDDVGSLLAGPDLCAVAEEAIEAVRSLRAELGRLNGELRAAEVMAKISTRSDREAVSALQVELNRAKALVASRDETIRALEFQLRSSRKAK